MSILDSLTPAARNLARQVEGIFGPGNVTFTSGKRDHIPPGGSRTSQHFSGNAFDFQVKGLDPLRVQERIAASGIGYGQSIAEYGLGMGPRNHLGVGTKKENLVARDGNYKPVNIADAAKSLRDRVSGWESQLLQWGGMSKGTADVLTDPNATVTETAGAVLFNSYFGRITLAVFALLLLAAALFMLRPSMLPSIPGVKK